MPSPTTVSSRCGCDACVEVYGPGAAWTPDGFCSFCAAQCYPPMLNGNEFTRASSSREHRLAAHGMKHASDPKPFTERAIDSVKDMRTQIAIEAGVTLAKTLSPLFPPKWRRVINAIGKNR